MSADRELLKLAAKAAGYTNFEWEFEVAFPRIYDPRGFMYGWNPLTDDGDRYRLAKKLDIRIHFGSCYVTYVSNNICGCVTWPENAKDDAYAIVQAAAEIGKAMP